MPFQPSLPVVVDKDHAVFRQRRRHRFTCQADAAASLGYKTQPGQPFVLEVGVSIHLVVQIQSSTSGCRLEPTNRNRPGAGELTDFRCDSLYREFCRRCGVIHQLPRTRDRFIGWNPHLRKKNLPLVIDNSRFLILPWIHIPNLGSQILALVKRRIPRDWTRRYNTAKQYGKPTKDVWLCP